MAYERLHSLKARVSSKTEHVDSFIGDIEKLVTELQAGAAFRTAKVINSTLYSDEHDFSARGESVVAIRLLDATDQEKLRQDMEALLTQVESDERFLSHVGEQVGKSYGKEIPGTESYQPASNYAVITPDQAPPWFR